MLNTIGQIYDYRKPLYSIYFHRIKDVAYDLPPEWDNPDNAWQRDELNRSFVPVLEGELVYNDSLNDLRREETTYSRYNVMVALAGQAGPQCFKDFHFEIRQRRQSDDTYVAVDINSATDTITLFEKQAGITTATASFSHTINVERLNWLELWVYDNKCYAFLNAAPIGELTISANNEDTFSFYAYQNADGSFCRFYQVQARELEPQPAEQGNTADLWVVLRQNIRDQINNPIPGDFAEFSRIWHLWLNNKDKPIPDRLWWDAGYPLRQPPTEEWQLKP